MKFKELREKLDTNEDVNSDVKKVMPSLEKAIKKEKIKTIKDIERFFDYDGGDIIFDKIKDEDKANMAINHAKELLIKKYKLKENSELNERGWKPESPAAFDKTMKDKKLQKDIAKFFDTDRHEFMTVKDAEKKFPYMIKYMKNSEFLKINKEKLTDKNLMMVAMTMSDD